MPENTGLFTQKDKFRQTHRCNGMISRTNAAKRSETNLSRQSFSGRLYIEDVSEAPARGCAPPPGLSPRGRETASRPAVTETVTSSVLQEKYAVPAGAKRGNDDSYFGLRHYKNKAIAEWTRRRLRAP
jgi:hypothetical protein